MALGAAAPDVVRMVVREGMLVAGFGIAAGLLLALVPGRLATTLLVRVNPRATAYAITP